MTFYSVPFYNICLKSFNIPCLFSGGITISSTFLEFASERSIGFAILLAILFPVNFPVSSAVLWNTFLEAVFVASSPVFVAVFNNFYDKIHIL